jgi:hypothetical protein
MMNAQKTSLLCLVAAVLGCTEATDGLRVTSDAADTTRGSDPSSSVACRMEAPSGTTRVFATHHGLALADGENITQVELNGCDMGERSSRHVDAALMGVSSDGTEFYQANENRAFAVSRDGTEAQMFQARWNHPYVVSQDGGTVAFEPACGPVGIYRDAGENWQRDEAQSAVFEGAGHPMGALMPTGMVYVTDADIRHVGTEDRFFASRSAGVSGVAADVSRVQACGPYVCGVAQDANARVVAVVVWQEDGEVAQLLSHGDVTDGFDEQIVDVSGNDNGLYVLLRGGQTQEPQMWVAYSPW